MKTDLQFWTESYQSWRDAVASPPNGFPSMYYLNNARKFLAKEIRKAEAKLNREPRKLPHLGCVQYIGSK
jgi:hypothetical protein